MRTVVDGGLLREAVTEWARYAGREANRRRVAATRAYAFAVRTAALRHARRATVAYGGIAGVALAAVPVTGSWTEVGCGAVAVLAGAKATRSAAAARRIARSPAPTLPAAPTALPVPPPLGSAAWPACAE